jgi:hypothetical protein
LDTDYIHFGKSQVWVSFIFCRNLAFQRLQYLPDNAALQRLGTKALAGIDGGHNAAGVGVLHRAIEMFVRLTDVLFRSGIRVNAVAGYLPPVPSSEMYGRYSSVHGSGV